MSGCPGCLPTGKALAQQYENIKRKAIEYAMLNQTDVAIYRDVEGWRFISSQVAFSSNYPIKEIITFSSLNG